MAEIKLWYCEICTSLTPPNNCGVRKRKPTVLGHIKGDTCYIRNKGFSVNVKGGIITYPCPKCGAINELQDPDYLKYLEKKYPTKEKVQSEKEQ